MGVGMGDAVVRGSMDGFVVPPVSRASSYSALWHPVARGPALQVFDRKASSWSVAGGRPWGEPLDGLQLSATSPRCPEGWLGGETPAFNLRADDWPIG